MDNYHDEKFREGYKVGEYERVALATKNSDLRSDILKLEQKYEETRILLDKFAKMMDHNVWAHDNYMWSEMKANLFAEYKEFENKYA
jgi:chaperonin GroEL (HSP60 family)